MGNTSSTQPKPQSVPGRAPADARSSGARLTMTGDDIADHFVRMLLTSLGEDGATERVVRIRSQTSTYSPGQKVKISGNVLRVKRCQVGHGGYINAMDGCIGKVGTVVRVDADGDVHVRFRSGVEWCFNPECFEPVDSSDLNSDDSGPGSDDDATTGLHRMLREFLRDESGGGRTVGAQRTKSSALHSASFLGREQLVRLLASSGANLEEEDKDGDRPIHYAAYGNEPGILTLLINLGADINAQNKRKQSALHIAVNKEFVNCVRVLTEASSRLDVNVQDGDGDTPIHDAVGKNSLEAIQMLVNFPAADFTIKNKRGFNVLHMAALKGNNIAVERILSKKPDLVNMKESTGHGALHIAAVNGYHHAVKTLLSQPNCTVDLQNNVHQTPLLLAAYKGYCDVVELLVQAGADINKPDDDGDTAMNLSLFERLDVQPQSLSASRSPAIAAVMHSLRESGHPGADSRLALACFLANQGGDLHRANKKGLSALTIAKSAEEVELLLIWKTKNCEPTPARATAQAEDRPEIRAGVCKICDESPANVRFEPCGHRLYCEECCKRMKCCLSCGAEINRKVAIEEKVLSYAKADSGAQKELESKLRAMEEAHNCAICLERQRNIIFMCGHGACSICARNLRDCHMCRRTITNRITLY